MVSKQRQEEAFNELKEHEINVPLKNLSTKISDGIHSTPNYSISGTIPFVNGNNIENGILNIENVQKYINREEYKSYNIHYGIGSVMVSLNGTIGEVGILNEKDILFGKSIGYINCKEDLNNDYLKHYLNTEKVKLELKKELTGSTIKNLSLNSIKNLKISIHTKNKQNKISTFLTSLDDLIQSQEQYIKALKVQKKGYSQKIFNQELRFKGFEDVWENSLIADHVNVIKGLNGVTKKNFETKNPNSSYIQFKNIHNNKVLKKDLGELYIEDFSKQNDIYKNDIVVTTSSENLMEVGTTNINKLDISNLYLNSFSFGLRPLNINSLFLHYVLKSSKIRKKIILKGQGITRINLSPNKFIEIKIQVPSNKEQQKIASLLSNLDDKIDFQEQKLDKLKLKKKYYLNQIFQ